MTTQPPTVDLLLPEVTRRDATGEHTMQLRNLLIEMGAEVQIVVERPTDVDVPVQMLRGWKGNADLTILQHSIGSRIAQAVIDSGKSVVLNYHNVTPFEFIEPWEPRQIEGLRLGRRQLDHISPLVRLGLADSGFNAEELRSVGCGVVRVAPILFDPEVLFYGFDSSLVGSLRVRVGEGPVWLFVGRLAPNKAQEDLIAAFAVFREWVPSGRLVLVGGESSVSYREALVSLVAQLGLEDSVLFAGSVSGAELAGWYEVADVFVCVSDHEGFCVPLLEAMHHRLPVVAYAAAAVPETLGGAGLLVGDKSAVVLAAAVERVVSDPVVGGRLVESGLCRLGAFGLERTREVFREALRPLLGIEQ